MLNSFLQFLEMDDSDSLVIGATNHVSSSTVRSSAASMPSLEYSLPTAKLAERAFKAQLQGLQTDGLDWPAVVGAAEGLNYDEIVKACKDAAKEAILEGTQTVTTDSLLQALRDRRTARDRPAERPS